MKVVQINAVYEYSSTGRTTTEMHEYFLEHDIDSYVFCTNMSIPEKNVYKFSNKFDIFIHAVLSRMFGRQGMYSHFATKRLINRLMQIRPDVVHLRVLHSNCINLPMLLNYLAEYDIPTVITLHDCWYFTGHCCYFIDSNCYRWQKKCGNCPDLKNWNPSYFFDNSEELLAIKKELFSRIKNLAVVGVSDWVTSFIKSSILKDAKVVKRIYNWVDFSKFTPRDTNLIRRSIGLGNNDFVVLGVAQHWTSTKGLDDFIKLAKRCLDVKFVIVGEIYRDDLPGNMIHLGIISDTNRLVDMYAMADVFFNPSLRETFGKVTVESMAAGTPVVAYDATATPEIVTEGCGFIIKSGDIESACEKINIIRRNSKSMYSKACIRRAVNNFSKDIIINQYIQLYGQLKSQ